MFILVYFCPKAFVGFLSWKFVSFAFGLFISLFCWWFFSFHFLCSVCLEPLFWGDLDLLHWFSNIIVFYILFSISLSFLLLCRNPLTILQNHLLKFFWLYKHVKFPRHLYFVIVSFDSILFALLSCYIFLNFFWRY